MNYLQKFLLNTNYKRSIRISFNDKYFTYEITLEETPANVPFHEAKTQCFVKSFPHSRIHILDLEVYVQIAVREFRPAVMEE